MSGLNSRGVRVLVIAILLSVLFSGVITPAYAETYGFILKWGSEGSDDGQFIYPMGIAVDSTGYIYVTDVNNYRVQKFTSDGDFILKWGSYGSGDGQFGMPTGVAVDASGNVYVNDRNNFRVQKFTSDGVFITKWGSEGSGDGQFGFIWGIAVDGSGNVYVADQWNYRVQKFTSDGDFITKWTTSEEPWGVAVDSSDYVYVAFDHCVKKFTDSGSLVTSWGNFGFGDGQFNAPIGVAVDSSGNVYVADTFNHRIQKFTSDGVFITKWGSEGSGDGQFNEPWGVAVDSSGNVYVADDMNHRIQKFALGSVYTLTITTTVGGTTDPPPGDYIYLAETVVDVLATPDTDYFFDHWELDGVNVGSINPFSVTMNTDHTLYAVFIQLPYDVIINAYCHAEDAYVSVSITMDGIPTGYNTPHTFTDLTDTHTFTVPSTDVNGHPFQHWSTSATSTTITVSSGGTYTGYYGVKFTLTITTTTGGTTSPSPGTHTYWSGTVISVTATPYTDYAFNHWELDGDNMGATNPISFTMDQDHSLHAVFVYSPPPSVPEFPGADISIMAATLAFLAAVYFTLKRKKQLHPKTTMISPRKA